MCYSSSFTPEFSYCALHLRALDQGVLLLCFAWFAVCTSILRMSFASQGTGSMRLAMCFWCNILLQVSTTWVAVAVVGNVSVLKGFLRRRLTV